MSTLVNTEYQPVYQQAISGDKLHRSKCGVGMKTSSRLATILIPIPLRHLLYFQAIRHLGMAFPRGLLNPDHMRSLSVDDHLPEPGPLENKETGSEKLQHNVIPKEHLQEDTDTGSKQTEQKK